MEDLFEIVAEISTSVRVTMVACWAVDNLKVFIAVEHR